MKLIKDCWTWIKEWNEWGMKDWIKAGIIVPGCFVYPL